MPVERAARIGGFHTLLAADQQLLTELGLERRHLLAQRRLRDVQDVGRSGDAAGVDDSDE